MEGVVTAGVGTIGAMPVTVGIGGSHMHDGIWQHEFLGSCTNMQYSLGIL